MPDFPRSNMFVAADGHLAEYLCHVELLDLTIERAAQLRVLHDHHAPDTCRVLAAALLCST